MYIHIHTHTHTHIHTYTHTYIHTYVHTNIHTCVAYIHHTYTHVHTYILTYIHTYTTHACMHMCIYAIMYVRLLQAGLDHASHRSGMKLFYLANLISFACVYLTRLHKRGYCKTTVSCISSHKGDRNINAFVC